MPLPPGLRYLAQVISSCLPPAVLVYVTLSLLVKRGIDIPYWLVVSSAIISRVVFLLILYVWNEIYVLFEARRKGALMVPQVHDNWPGGLSVVGAMVKSFKTGYVGDIFLDWCKHYGNTYCLKIVGEHRIFTYEPEHVKAILATQFDNFEKGSISRSMFTTLLGTGVFNSDGEMWKFHRTITRPFFSKERISHFDVFDWHAEKALDAGLDRLAAGFPIDFQDLASRFTLDSATEFLFGKDVGSLSAELPYPSSSPSHPPQPPHSKEHPSTRFVKAFVTGQTNAALRSRYGPIWPLYEFWKDRVTPYRAVVDEFTEPILEEALKNNLTQDSAEKEDVESNSQTLLGHLVGQTQDRQMLKDELTNLLVAARDTTASTLTFAMYMLTQHPNVVRRLRAEIVNIVGTGRPTYEQIKQMKYMRAFVNETLRLYPPVPFDSRTSKGATTWPTRSNPDGKPFYIPARTKCTYGVFIMHRRTDLWGPDALKFDPDRFLDERVHKYLTANPFIFLPFNAGPRICLGQQFAYHETSFMLTRVLQRFANFQLVPPTIASGSGSWEGEKVRPAMHLTMYVKGGLWIRMDPAPLDTDLDLVEGGKTL